MQYKTDRRLSYVPVTEANLQISQAFPYTAILKELPDLAAAVTIHNYTRVYAMPQAATDFFVDRTGNIYFHQSRAGQVVTVTYMGGGSRLSASDWNEMIDSLANTQSLITGITSLIFGNIRLRITPTAISTTATTMNSTVSGHHIVTFTASLVNLSNQVYTWLQDMPLYVSIRASFVTASIAIPTITPTSLLFTNGVCQFTSTYQTDFGAYKKYTAGDYVNYTFSTVDPTTQIGINLSVVVVDSIH